MTTDGSLFPMKLCPPSLRIDGERQHSTKWVAKGTCQQ